MEKDIKENYTLISNTSISVIRILLGNIPNEELKEKIIKVSDLLNGSWKLLDNLHEKNILEKIKIYTEVMKCTENLIHNQEMYLKIKELINQL